MIKLFSDSLLVLENSFHRIEEKAEKPELTQVGRQIFYRYKSRSAKLALLQKYARIISGLYAATLLLEPGMLQELGAIYRMLDEFIDDSMFLNQATNPENMTDLHRDYLNWFYQEEFSDPDFPLSSKPKRAMVSRKRIYSAIASKSPLNPFDDQNMSRVLNQVFSGYVHGASGHILEMYEGEPSRYSLFGKKDSASRTSVTIQLINYFHRAIETGICVALAFDDYVVVDDLFSYRAEFGKMTGLGDWDKKNTEKVIRTLKNRDAPVSI